MRSFRCLLILLPITVCIVAPTISLAQWVENGVPICTATGHQGFHSTFTPPHCGVISDGNNGAIITWIDFRGADMDIYAQRVNTDGYVQWTGDGVPVCTAPGNQGWPRIVPDDNDGAVIVWSDHRGFPYGDIYAQKIGGNGQPAWAADGVLVFDGQKIYYPPGASGVVTDEAGGAFFVTLGDTTQDVFVQKIDGSGTLPWGNRGLLVYEGSDPVPPDTLTESFLSAQIVPDNVGGAIVTWTVAWEDSLWTGSNVYDSLRIFAQRVDPSGTMQWGSAGVVVYDVNDVNIDFAIELTAIPDGSGGAIVMWKQDSGTVMAQKIDASGQNQWTEVPRDYLLGGVLMPDDSGGAIGANTDWMSDVAASRTSAGGDNLWLTTLCSGTGFGYAVAASDGAGGAIVAWRDGRRDSYPNYFRDIYARKVDSSGNAHWTANGVPIRTVAGSIFEDAYDIGTPHIASDGAGGAIIVWADHRDMMTNYFDVYAQRVYASGAVGGGPRCAVVPTALDFGDVLLGSAKDTTFIITNEGSGSLSGSVSESCDHYSIISGDGAYALAGGNTLVVTVRFEPSAVGSHDCTVETGQEICSDVFLTGRGYSCDVTHSDFDDGTVQGWYKLEPFGGELVNVPRDAGGCMKLIDMETGGNLVVLAPCSYLGDLSSYYGIHWDAYVFSCPGYDIIRRPLPVLIGVDSTTYRPAANQLLPLDQWHTLTVPFVSTAWELTENSQGTASFEEVLQNVIVFRFAMECNNGGLNCSDESMVDNITLATTPSAVTDNPPLRLNVAAIPNPFNPSTTIHYTVPAADRVDLAVFDVAGRLVDRLIAGEHKPAGVYRLQYAPSAVTGIYFLRLRVGQEVTVKKIVLIK